MKKLILCFIATYFIITNAYGGILDDIAKVVTAPITAPTEATIKILKGDDPTTVVTRPLHSGGRLLQETTNAAQKVNDKVLTVKRDLIRKNLGKDWEKAFNVLTASERNIAEMAFTSGRFLGGCLQGQACNIQQLTAMPLASALRDAYKIYWPYSEPLDYRFRQWLGAAVPWHVLNSARISVGNVPDMTIPGFLNSGNKAFGHDHAVTIANVVIFSRFPQLRNCNDLQWFLHELQHVAQYMSYSQDALESIDGFSVDYIQHSGNIENNAENTANAWMAQLRRQYGFICN